LARSFPDCSGAGTGFLEENRKLSPAIRMPGRPAGSEERSASKAAAAGQLVSPCVKDLDQAGDVVT